jgi:hypothetical protein
MFLEKQHYKPSKLLLNLLSPYSLKSGSQGHMYGPPQPVAICCALRRPSAQLRIESHTISPEKRKIRSTSRSSVPQNPSPLRGRMPKASPSSSNCSTSSAASPSPAGCHGRKSCRHEAPTDVDITCPPSLPRVHGGFGQGNGVRSKWLEGGE